MAAEIQKIHESIILHWSDWTPWHHLPLHGESHRGNLGIKERPGVYEVRFVEADQRLTIGESKDLYQRLRKDLVKGNHSAGERFRDNIDTKIIEVRWAMELKHIEAEVALKGLHVIKYGNLPEFTKK
jgi:hypothetical protein